MEMKQAPYKLDSHTIQFGKTHLPFLVIENEYASLQILMYYIDINRASPCAE